MAAAPVREYIEHGRPHLARGPEVRALFLNQRGQDLSRQGLWLVVKRWSATCGLGADVSPHSLRHSMAHHLLDQGKSRREVQQLLGLSSPNAIRGRRSSAAG
jgi:integrase/recombinase XerD